jgi:hypothetical protein
MPRIKFSKNDQHKFLDDVRNNLQVEWLPLSKLLGISKRNLFDWRREKIRISEVAFKKCLELTKEKVNVPEHEILPDFCTSKRQGEKVRWQDLKNMDPWVRQKGEGRADRCLKKEEGYTLNSILIVTREGLFQNQKIAQSSQNFLVLYLAMEALIK